ncbi:STAS domain-containing protein [Mycobacterium innocens]|uniref:STAS domain-containing protein n=1 Tax=Mycobacterium innocens TaxID=2341083 RepID=UPI001FCA1C31|nr:MULTISPECIES: STAS domain-containing protein [Mycobacterium]
MAEHNRHVTINVERQDGAVVLTVEGVLDSLTYRELRDAVIKVALEEPRAVLVDVSRLSVPSASAWSVFTSARWHVSTWPDVAILLTSQDPETRRVITSVGVARYVPVHPTRESALGAVDELSLHSRRRSRAQLPPTAVSVRVARSLIQAWLTAWARNDLVAVAATVTTVLVENVLAHTDSAPVLVVENYRDTVTVAVEDNSHQPAVRYEDAAGGTGMLSGLSIITALCRAWGSTPTSSGKTVWALVGPENQL